MTVRALGVLAFSGGSIASGWYVGWPELTALGAGGVMLVLVTVLTAGPRPRAGIDIEQSSMRVVRGEPAVVRISLRLARRRRGLRLVTGAVKRPTMSVPIAATRRERTADLRVPLDTSKRGRFPVGPFSVVQDDPWSLVRRVAACAEGGTVTVLPKTFPLQRSVLTTVTIDDTSLSSHRPGEHHFHALRDYVLGDEPRMIHWRSSARAGHLVVRQHVSAATQGTTVVLDCDMSAYGSDEAFGSGWREERFEAAVEMAASVCVAESGRDEQVHLVTSSRGAAPVTATAGGAANLLDALAVVRAVPPVEALPEELPSLVRRTRCARVVVVSGTPGQGIVAAARRLRQGGTPTLLVRVGARQCPAVSGVRVLDMEPALT